MIRGIRCRYVVVAAVASAAAAISGCETYRPYGEPTSPEDTVKAAEELALRPSLEDTERRVEDAMLRIAEAATGLDPNLQWYWHRERRASPCPKPFDDTDGWEVRLRAYRARGPVGDEDRPAFQEAARRIAEPFGATQVHVIRTRPVITT